RYQTVRYHFDLDATLYSTLENILDVPHTSFLHRGLFRGGPAQRIQAVIRRYPDRVEAEFMGESRPKGIVGLLLAPGGGTVSHVDRFIFPRVAQVEYSLSHVCHLLISDVVTPHDDYRSRMNAVLSVRLPWGARAVKTVVTPIAKRIVAQNAEMLSAQT